MTFLLRATAALFCLTLGAGGAEGQQSTAESKRPHDNEVVQQMTAHAVAHPGGTAPYSFDAAAFSGDIRQLPIGVFDSGIGGLTVLEAILTLDAFDNQTLHPGADGRPDFEHERFIYFGDQANMPYGNYAAAGQQDYLRELILKDAVFMLGQRYYPTRTAQQPVFDKPPVKAIVIACNTATAYGFEDILRAVERWQVPVFVVGVVQAGAQGVMQRIPQDGDAGTVAVLATAATCSSMAYPKAIRRALGIAGKPAPRVVQQGSVGLAGAIEGDPSFVTSDDQANAASSPHAYAGPRTDNPAAVLDAELLPQYQFDAEGLRGNLAAPETLKLNSIENYVRYEVTTLVEKYRRNGGGEPISMVVLGCTHFPLVGPSIAAAFDRMRRFEDAGGHPYAPLIAEKMQFVDPASMTAKELFRKLAKSRLRADPNQPLAVDEDLFFLSVPNPASPGIRLDATGGLEQRYKYDRSPGRLTVEDTRAVPMTWPSLPDSSRSLIRTYLPEVSKRLR